MIHPVNNPPVVNYCEASGMKEKGEIPCEGNFAP